MNIKNVSSGKILFTASVETIRELVLLAIKSGANLSGADLSRANLSGANLSRADLSCANLSGANLSDADLSRANLYRADLSGANLYRADLYRADLSCANLSGANLFGADLSGADLSRANLSGADLSGANLYRADLSGANLSGAKGLNPVVPEEGSFIGFKKLANGVIAKILIPEDAKRLGGFVGRKCRASKAIVLEGAGVSKYDSRFIYAIGQIVEPDSYDDNPFIECSNGIHFFITRKEAEQY